MGGLFNDDYNGCTAESHEDGRADGRTTHDDSIYRASTTSRRKKHHFVTLEKVRYNASKSFGAAVKVIRSSNGVVMQLDAQRTVFL